MKCSFDKYDRMSGFNGFSMDREILIWVVSLQGLLWSFGRTQIVFNREGKILDSTMYIFAVHGGVVFYLI
jgi:hypothetical protein